MNVSIVIPLYNKARHIQRALNSITAQTYGDFEVIVVDDGSTDGGAAIVSQSRDTRVRLISQTNSGVSAARNRGVSEARCEHIAFLDADDEWLPDFLCTVLDLRERFPQAKLWATGFCYSDAGAITRNRFNQSHAVTDSNGFILDTLFTEVATWTAFLPSCVSISKTELLAVGGFPVGVEKMEDGDTWLRMALRYSIAWTPLNKVIIYADADNRTEEYSWIGVWPFFESVREYVEKDRPTAALPDAFYSSLAQGQTALFRHNLLAHNRSAIIEIAKDCRHIPGFWFKCNMWYTLSFVPHPLVILIWKLKSWFVGRGWNVPRPRFRSIRRSAMLGRFSA